MCAEQYFQHPCGHIPFNVKTIDEVSRAVLIAIYIIMEKRYQQQTIGFCSDRSEYEIPTLNWIEFYC